MGNYVYRTRSSKNAGSEEEPTQFSWTDVLAFTIAAYQIFFPILLVFAGVVGLIYLLLVLLAR